MSLPAVRWVRGLRLPPTSKLVLWVLADAANDTGACWPSVAALREWTCLSERAVQDALRLLERVGAMVVVQGGGRGRTQRYVLQVGAPIAWERPSKDGKTVQQPHPLPADTVQEAHPLGVETGQEAHPSIDERVQQPHPLSVETGQEAHLNADTVQQPHPLPAERVQEVHPEPVALLGKEERVSEGGGRAARAPRQPITSRILPDWTPSPADVAFASERGLDVSAVAEQFRDYWLSIGGERSRKADWSATWRVWVRKEAERGGGKMGAPTRSGGRQAAPDPWLNGRSIFDEPADSRGPVIDGTAERWP